jgi:hypothetical protein
MQPTAAKADGRGAGAKARWANMSPEDKATHVAKMQAGRKKRKKHTGPGPNHLNFDIP